MNNIKNLVAAVKANKGIIIKRTLIVGGSAAGLILTAGLLKKNSELADDEYPLVEEGTTIEHLIVVNPES